jgi:hypothetical protein
MLDQLAKKTAEIALRLATLPADERRCDNESLDAIEHLATQILKEVSAMRLGKTYSIGETSGMWRAVPPTRH